MTPLPGSDMTHRAPRVDGKFLNVDGVRFLVKGVAYGTFAPDASGGQFPAPSCVATGTFKRAASA